MSQVWSTQVILPQNWSQSGDWVTSGTVRELAIVTSLVNTSDTVRELVTVRGLVNIRDTVRELVTVRGLVNIRDTVRTG